MENYTYPNFTIPGGYSKYYEPLTPEIFEYYLGDDPLTGDEISEATLDRDIGAITEKYGPVIGVVVLREEIAQEAQSDEDIIGYVMDRGNGPQVYKLVYDMEGSDIDPILVPVSRRETRVYDTILDSYR